MRHAGILNLLLFCALAATAAWGFIESRKARDAEFLKEKLSLAEADNARLTTILSNQKRASHEETQKVKRTEIEQRTSSVRELPFKHPVTYDVISRKRVVELLQEKIRKQFPDDQFDRMAAGYTALGLIPEGYDLKRELLTLLGEQVAAFYDQHEHKLFMYEDADLSSSQNQVILMHELTHALQDQNFDLSKFPLETGTNDDLATACGALIEGDATLVMQDRMSSGFSFATIKETVGSLFTQDLTKLTAAPRFLRESLLFPYVEGANFCAHALSEGNWSEVTRIYADPPTSTTEILHPERYFAAKRFRPVEIVWEATQFRDKPPYAQNVLGEFGIRLLLKEWGDAEQANRAAEGWLGDAYLVYDKGQYLVWRTRWENQTQLAEFFHELIAAMKKRYGAAPLGDKALQAGSIEEGRCGIQVVPEKGELTLFIAPNGAGLRDLAASVR